MEHDKNVTIRPIQSWTKTIKPVPVVGRRRRPTACVWISLLILLAGIAPASAQISHGGSPASLGAGLRDNIETITMPALDVAALLAEDEADSGKEQPFRFGYPFPVHHDMDEIGTWSELPNGDLVWRLRIVSADAYSINLVYDHFEIPDGASFFVYNEERGEKKRLIGAFTAANNKDHNMFATAPVAGDRIVLEYNEPVNADFPGKISISTIVHAYRDLFSWDFAKEALGFGSSGSCNNNVNCPEGDPWQDDNRGVAMILTSSGSRICSGSLVNNIRQDETPYFLTANHCLGGSSTWIFMFNYESPNCTNVDGPTYMTVQGSSLLANTSTSDFALLLLNEPPPDSYQVYFAGWSALDTESDSAVGIHHPRGDIKKISFDFDTYTSTDYLQSSGTSHWRIGNWEDGTTEPGSSGSPLFNKHHQVIGQLHGGYASCSSITSDWYGKFAVSWDNGSTPSTRLKDWLDPDNTGALTLTGFDPYAQVAITHTPLSDTRDTTNAYEVLCTITTDVPLIPDSLLLRYRIQPSPFWVKDTLIATGTENEYHGFIPPQQPGSEIEYYLYAISESGSADTSDIYSFRVIDYAVSIDPQVVSGTAAAYDTAWYDLTVTSQGVYEDNYNLSTAYNGWTTTLWDETGSYEISATGLLLPDELLNFKVSVEVPASVYGDSDSAIVTATSQNSGSVSAASILHTVSAGEPLTIPFYDGFADTEIDYGNWVLTSGIEINGAGTNEPSGDYSVNFDGSPGGADTLMSQAIDLDGYSGINISYFYERGGGGDSPESGDDLWVEYLNQYSSWTTLNHHPGDGTDMSSYAFVSVPVPAEGYHSGFRLRFRNTATSGDLDDWFVDDIQVDFGPDINVEPESYLVNVAKGDSTERVLAIENPGAGVLTYSIVAAPDLPFMSVIEEMLERGEINPASYRDPDGHPEIQLGKDVIDTRIGPEVKYNGGGPDAFGYVWLDSDADGGPTYQWIDVLTTGTELTGSLDDDNYSGPYPIGFDFRFYGNVYDQFYLGSNGIIGFGPATDLDAYQNTALPYADTPNNMIALCWDDLDITDPANTTGKVVYDAQPNRCVIQFNSYPEYDGASGDVIDAEIILYPDGTIKLQYQYIAPGFDRLGCTVGIENLAGDDGIEVVRNADYLHDLLAIEIVSPAQWIHLSSSEGLIPGGGADTLAVKFLSADLDSGYYSGTIKVFSNDPDSEENPVVIPVEFNVGDTTPDYVCGDTDGDEVVNITDVTYVIAYIFGGGSAPEPYEAGDVDCNQVVNISDATYLLAYIFGGGSPPCSACP